MQTFDVIVEGNHSKGIVLAQHGQASLYRFARLLDRRALHGSRPIQDNHSAASGFRTHSKKRGRNNCGEGAHSIARCARQHLRRDLFETDVQHQIAIRNVSLRGQRHVGRRHSILSYANGVRWGAYFVNRELMQHRDVESNLMQRIRVLPESWKKHVAELIGRQFHLAFLFGDSGRFHARVVCRRKRERKTKAESVVAQLDAGQQLQIHRNGLVGSNISNRQIHHAITVLARERRKRPLRDASLVGLDGCFCFN